MSSDPTYPVAPMMPTRSRADPVVADHAALAAGWEPRRAVRRDPDRRLEPCAHGRTVALRGATLLTGSGLGSMAGSGWTVVMGV